MTSLRAVDEMNLSLWKQLQLVRGTAEEDEVARVEAAVTEAVDRHRDLHRDRFPYLHHPGTLVSRGARRASGAWRWARRV